ncbi:MAG: lasso peptide biosynthesis PqqD family chaperone [Bacteroidota bacterium]|nr:lasso peptide biosynthesis PqqD family chaperone [Bacteroidota bacterium]
MKKSIKTRDVIIRNPEMLFSKMDGEIVMMSLENNEYYGLGDSGTSIWELIEDEMQVSVLINTLCAKYEVDEDLCKIDTLTFLNELYEKNLILIK